MKLSYGWAAGILAGIVGLTGLAGTSASAQEPQAPTASGGALRVQSLHRVPRNNPHLQRLFRLQEIQPLRTRIDWDNVVLATYSQKQAALLAQVLNEDGSQSTLTAFFHSKQPLKGFRVAILSVTANKDAETTKFAVYTSGGALLGGAIYHDGEQVGDLAPDGFTAQGVDWPCFRNCLRNVWGWLPGWLRVVCNASINSCIGTGNPYSCSAAAGCLGGAIGSCVWGCWR